MAARVNIHITPDTGPITWNTGALANWVQIGEDVTIFVPDEETAKRLVSVLLVIRQRTATHRDKVVEKLPRG